MYLIFDVAIDWNCYIYHYCLLLQFVDHHNVQLVSHRRYKVSLYLEVLQDLNSVILYHFNCETSNPNSAQMFLCTILWRFMYAIFACILHPATMCWTVSKASLNSLHLGCCLVC